MNTRDIRSLCEGLDKAKERLSSLNKEASGLSLGAHQTFVSIVVQSQLGTRRLDVTDMDDRSYMAKQTRGMEMVLLGIKKWYAGEIDRAKEQVADFESRIRSAAS